MNLSKDYILIPKKKTISIKCQICTVWTMDCYNYSHFRFLILRIKYTFLVFKPRRQVTFNDYFCRLVENLNKIGRAI